MLLIGDANIFIDLDAIGAIELIKSLECEIVVTDMVFHELYTSQKTLLQKIDIKILDFQPSELIDLYNTYNGLNTTGISPQDYSLVYKAKQHNGSILTGDKKLKNFSKRENIQVYGIFYIIDQFLETNIMDLKEWETLLQALQNANCRLPQKEFEKRFEQCKTEGDK